jgi:hypothetical protein
VRSPHRSSTLKLRHTTHIQSLIVRNVRTTTVASTNAGIFSHRKHLPSGRGCCTRGCPRTSPLVTPFALCAAIGTKKGTVGPNAPVGLCYFAPLFLPVGPANLHTNKGYNHQLHRCSTINRLKLYSIRNPHRATARQLIRCWLSLSRPSSQDAKLTKLFVANINFHGVDRILQSGSPLLQFDDTEKACSLQLQNSRCIQLTHRLAVSSFCN